MIAAKDVAVAMVEFRNSVYPSSVPMYLKSLHFPLA
jgi:hypothetical protein